MTKNASCSVTWKAATYPFVSAEVADNNLVFVDPLIQSD